MKKLLATLVSVVLLISYTASVYAQEEEIAPEEITVVNLNSTPNEFLLSGKSKTNQLSSEIIVDLVEIPQNAEILDIELSFEQTGTSEGLLKILNKRSLSIIDSISLGKEGSKSTKRIDTTVQEWITNPEKNFGLIFQTSELGDTDEVKIGTISFKVEYYVPDKTNPTVTKLEIKVVDPFTVNLIWETDEPVTVEAKYGKTSNYDKSTEKTIEFSDKGTLTIRELSENNSYHLKFFAIDARGNTTETGNTVFTTNTGNITNIVTENLSVLPPRLFNHELVPIANGRYSVELAWSKSETINITGYILYRNIGDGEYSELSRFDNSVTRYTDSKVEPDTTYSYYVVAYSGTSLSGRSPVVQVTLPENSDILGISTLFQQGNSNLAVFFLLSGFMILMGVVYFVWKKVKLNMAYNEKMNRHARLHNVLHDPDYYINGYEDSVIEKVSD